MEIVENIAPITPSLLAIAFEDEESLKKLAKAINSDTRRSIIRLLNEKPMDVSNIATRLEQTEANISAQIQILQDANLVSSHYEPGSHGVRKICHLTFSKLTINLV